ncbi:AT-rich interactive domain-containing protein 6-like [Impatiens glandulifera]|uniref:AT-rich interactive domain-containing protein 6-like n=1 Tax=Impatiens glandulifera TaxID=253017 RepID=UPI001FB0B58B|nr:AT-rich interactive domain-containing protein 6-like [Impatiens glandulifera]
MGDSENQSTELAADRENSGNSTNDVVMETLVSPELDVPDETSTGEMVLENEGEVNGNMTEENPNENGKEEEELTREFPVDELGHVAAVTSSAIADENKKEGYDSPSPVMNNDAVTPSPLLKCNTKAVNGSIGTLSKEFNEMTEEDEDGTLEEQTTFMKEVECFYKEKALEFKPPRFYGQPLNCLKLWRAVTKLGGYDRVTGAKLWRQVGESFHPPKTCTTVSWTFRIFYEKALLEYERYKLQNGELELAAVPLPEPSSIENEVNNGPQAQGSVRARRDAAARAMQGWHVQRLLSSGEGGAPIIKDKSSSNLPKREKSLKSISSVKQKRTPEVEHPVKSARIDTAKPLVTTVVDIGPPADWVKINVFESKECYEVYALVPGLLREEVRVQSDPAGRLIITGQPEQTDNPWGITAFKKEVSLPARIDPLQTSAVVSLHGRLYVRIPIEQS